MRKCVSLPGSRPWTEAASSSQRDQRGALVDGGLEEYMTEASTPNGAATSENPNGLNEDSPAPLVEMEMMRQELAVIQFLERLDHLYRDLLDSRDRELTVKDRIYQDLLSGRDREIEVKDRLIAELERRAQ